MSCGGIDQNVSRRGTLTGSRLLWARTLGWLLLVLSLAAADPDLAGASRGARETAEAQLAAARLRVAGEQAVLLKELQDAVAASNIARDRLARAEQEAAVLRAELITRTKDHERELALVKQLADRAVIAARLDETQSRQLAREAPLARVEGAIAGLQRRLAELPARLARRCADEAVVGRRGKLATVPVLRLGEARAIALGSTHETRGILERAADGSSWLVVGPDLPADAVVKNGTVALIPLDAAGSAAHQASAVHRSFAEWVEAGRFFIWPTFAVFLLGIAVAIERMVVLNRRRVDHRHLVAVAARLAANDVAGASALVGAGKDPLARVLGAGIRALDRPREAREAIVEQALLAETAALTRGLPAIAVMAGVAPLLGLLGTVTGMIDMFSVIATQGSGNAKSLSGGISEALICTQAGMLVAIPLLLLHAWLSRMADRRSHMLEEAACGVLGLTEHGPASTARPGEVLA